MLDPPALLSKTTQATRKSVTCAVMEKRLPAWNEDFWSSLISGKLTFPPKKIGFFSFSTKKSQKSVPAENEMIEWKEIFFLKIFDSFLSDEIFSINFFLWVDD